MSRGQGERAERVVGRWEGWRPEGGIRFAGVSGVGYCLGPSGLIFRVEEAQESAFTARTLGEPIFTEASSMEDLRQPVVDAVQCRFKPGKAPRFVRLPIVKEEVLTA